MHLRPAILRGVAAAVVGGLVLMGCAGGSWLTYTGQKARPENRIPLERGGPHAEVWKTRDLAVSFTYRWDDRGLEIAGEVVPLGPIVNFQVIHRLDLRLHFLDAEGVILATRGLWNPGVRTNVDMLRWTFQHLWPVPAKTWAVGFSYAGVVGDGAGRGSDDDIGGAVDWEFWYGP